MSEKILVRDIKKDVEYHVLNVDNFFDSYDHPEDLIICDDLERDLALYAILPYED